MRNLPSRSDIQVDIHGVSPQLPRNFETNLGSLDLSHRENVTELSFGYWLAFACECGDLLYCHRLRGNRGWILTSKHTLSSSVLRSAHIRLGKLSSFEETKASKESLFSGLYLAGNFRFKDVRPPVLPRLANFQNQGSVSPCTFLTLLNVILGRTHCECQWGSRVRKCESTEYHGMCHSAHRMLEKLSYFEEGKASKESLLSGLYLAVTV